MQHHVERSKQHKKVQDDVCYDGCPELPPVVLSPSPKKTGNVVTEDVQNSSSEDSEEEEFECDSEGDPAWNYSDYDLKEDDELFAENVDNSEEDEMVDKGRNNAAQHAFVPGSDDVKEEDLELPVEDDSEKRHKSDSDDEGYKKKKRKNKWYTSSNHLI